MKWQLFTVTALAIAMLSNTMAPAPVSEAVAEHNITAEAQQVNSVQQGALQEVWIEADLLGEKVLVQLTEVGTAETTGYCPCTRCCGKWAGGRTASGTWAQHGRTVGIDPAVVPYGALVYIDGTIYTNEDCPAQWAIAKADGVLVDLYYDDHAAAWSHGRQKTTLFLVDALK